MKKKRNAVILWKKRNNYGKNVMVGTSVKCFKKVKIDKQPDLPLQTAVSE